VSAGAIAANTDDGVGRSGVMDISAALIVYGVMGSNHSAYYKASLAASSAPRTFSGGIPTAILGLALHFVIAFAVATVFLLASRAMPSCSSRRTLRRLYGIARLLLHESRRCALSAATKISLPP